MADVWLIVDATERPDLAERVQNETIHTLRCAHCGTLQPIDAPLLFHDGRTDTLIFAAQATATAEQNHERARELGQQLIAGIPQRERRPYLATAQSVTGVAGLREALTEPVEQTSDALSEALPALMAALNPAQVQAVVHEHPVLQSAEAIEQLLAYVEQLRSQQHDDLAVALAQRIDAIGADAAPDHSQTTEPSSAHPALQVIQALLDADSAAQRQELLRTLTVTPEIPTMLAALAEQAQRQQLDAVARDLLVIRDEVINSLNHYPPTTQAPEGA